jgi:hypothetical protein
MDTRDGKLIPVPAADACPGLRRAPCDLIIPVFWHFFIGRRGGIDQLFGVIKKSQRSCIPRYF